MKKAILLSAGLTALLFVAAPAQAQVELSAECSWYGAAEFQLECDEFSFYAYCDAECSDFNFQASCVVDCEAECVAVECDVDPGNFDCNVYCEGECGAYCNGECGSTSDSAYCQGECEAYCEGECGASCDIQPPDIECEGGCSASCEGYCQAEVEFDCHMGCEIDSHINCDAEFNTEGVLVCNGDVVDGFTIEEALEWLSEHGIEITYEGDASCSGNSCEASANAAITCAATNPGATEKPSLLALVSSLF